MAVVRVFIAHTRADEYTCVCLGLTSTIVQPKRSMWMWSLITKFDHSFAVCGAVLRTLRKLFCAAAFI